MTSDQFEIFWAATYSLSPPLSHRLRNDYPDRWFRIHSLPDSKRYPENKNEWSVLLERQNILFNDLFGNDSPIIMVTGEYSEGTPEAYPISNAISVKGLLFIPLKSIDLHRLDPECYSKGQIYRPLFMTEIWQSHKFDGILHDIANDELRALFISINRKCIIAPYDGGVDIILDTTQTRDSCKKKYKNWLSARIDGL